MSENKQESIKQSKCIVIPENIKPLIECCRDYEQGKISSTDFFSKTLIRTGEFMQRVELSKKTPKSEVGEKVE